MSSRVALVLGVFVSAASVAACAAPPVELGTPTAQVTIDGAGTDSFPVTCSQVRWQWTIETSESSPGFTAIFNTEQTVTAGLVRLRDVGGFSGTFIRDIVGEAQATFENDTVEIAGTAFGAVADRPTEQTSRSFTIQTDC